MCGWITLSDMAEFTFRAAFSLTGLSSPSPDNTNPNPRGYTFSGLNITGNSVDVQFLQTSGYPWVVVGEVTFNGSSTPEPSSLLLLGSGLVGAVGVIRRKINL